MPEIISVTEAARNFSDVINRVYYQGQSYLLTRGGTVVAQLSAVGTPLTDTEWCKRWQDRPHLDPHDAADWGEDLNTTKAAVAPPEVDGWDS